MEAKVSQCEINNLWRNNGEALIAYTHPFWARATTETHIKIGSLEEPILALVDHGFEFNNLFRRIYEKDKWPIDTNHGWMLRVANNERNSLYREYSVVGIKINDVKVEQNFFLENQGSYLINLEQPYIIAPRMETKLLDGGSYYPKKVAIMAKDQSNFL